MLLNQSPVQKGIETGAGHHVTSRPALNQSPVQKGIETSGGLFPSRSTLLNQSPVQKGIETSRTGSAPLHAVEPEPRSEGD